MIQWLSELYKFIKLNREQFQIFCKPVWPIKSKEWFICESGKLVLILIVDRKHNMIDEILLVYLNPIDK